MAKGVGVGGWARDIVCRRGSAGERARWPVCTLPAGNSIPRYIKLDVARVRLRNLKMVRVSGRGSHDERFPKMTQASVIHSKLAQMRREWLRGGLPKDVGVYLQLEEI